MRGDLGCLSLQVLELFQFAFLEDVFVVQEAHPGITNRYEHLPIGLGFERQDLALFLNYQIQCRALHAAYGHDLELSYRFQSVHEFSGKVYPVEPIQVMPGLPCYRLAPVNRGRFFFIRIVELFVCERGELHPGRIFLVAYEADNIESYDLSFYVIVCGDCKGTSIFHQPDQSVVITFAEIPFPDNIIRDPLDIKDRKARSWSRLCQGEQMSYSACHNYLLPLPLHFVVRDAIDISLLGVP